MSKVRGIRGATTASRNEKDEVFEATSELLAELVKRMILMLMMWRRRSLPRHPI